jgi:precorrin-4 C11-methyltransferase
MQKKIAIVPIGEAGRRTAARLQEAIALDTCLLCRDSVAAHWNAFDAFVFVGAMGICVRTIAPCIKDKHKDPAVVCVDSLGHNAIAVLSGHIGGANDLTRLVAACLGAHEVVTTQSDNAGLWALDTFEQRFDWALMYEGCLNDYIFAFVNREPTALLLDVCDEGTDYLERSLPPHVTIVKSIDEVDATRFRLLIAVTPYYFVSPHDVLVLHFIPKVLTVGFGLARYPDDFRDIYEQIDQAVTDQGIMLFAREWCTIDVKADEPFVEVLKEHGERVRFFTAGELAAVDVPNPSAVVERHVDTPSVCEAAAILGSNNGRLLVEKMKGRNWTAALAIDYRHLRPRCSDAGQGHVEIVGAGPGDPDLISVRGRRMLEKADLILYAGSLVPKALTDCHKPGAVVRSSADMNLEEQCALMKEHYDKGHFIVRLHTGDPCIFGAIQEQMAFFDTHGMHYHITPGISSFLAAAAELQSQFTIPQRCQTIILTRGEGRTPMPEREKLHLLARSRSTMCIFLSAAIVDDVQRELLMEYPEDTPVAACYHLTWPDQRICRGILKDLAKIVRDNHLTLTTMLVVGEAIDNRQGLSELYNKYFTHLYRKGGI